MMRTRTRLLCVIALALWVLSTAGNASVLTVASPETLSLTNGETASVDILVDGVVNLYTWEFSLAYNPALLEVEEVSEGDFLSQRGATFFFEGIVDSGAGLLSFVSASLLGTDEFGLPLLDDSGVTGSGRLATVRFRALMDGQSTVQVRDVLLLDPAGLDAEAVPEPSTWLLMLSAAAMAGALRKRGLLMR